MAQYGVVQVTWIDIFNIFKRIYNSLETQDSQKPAPFLSLEAFAGAPPASSFLLHEQPKRNSFELIQKGIVEQEFKDKHELFPRLWLQTGEGLIHARLVSEEAAFEPLR